MVKIGSVTAQISLKLTLRGWWMVAVVVGGGGGGHFIIKPNLGYVMLS